MRVKKIYAVNNVVFLKDANIIFIFYDHYNKETFDKAKQFVELSKDNNIKSDCVYALIGNKNELCKNNKEYNNIVSDEEILEFVDDKNLIFSHLSILEKYSNGVNNLSLYILKNLHFLLSFYFKC